MSQHPYLTGAEIRYADQAWVYDRTTSGAPVPAPREFRHSLSARVNGLVAQRLVLLHSSDSSRCTPDPAADPGTGKHGIAIAPPWLRCWAA